MKKLAKILLIVLVFFIVSGFENSETPKNDDDTNNERIEVIFNSTLKFNDLVKIKLDMAEKGISLMYRELKFNKNGKLISIDFKVDCNDGFSGSAHQNSLSTQSKIGFYRDYSDNTSSPFGTGRID